MTKQTLFCLISTKIVYFFCFILAEGGVHESTLPDHILDQQPTIQELISHARIADWNELGVALKLDNETLAGCHNLTCMYQLWIQEKADKATRKSLLNTLRAIKQNNVASIYENHLKSMVSYILYINVYIINYL